MSPEDRQKIAQIVEILKTSRKVFCITGAGISADSGLPTYRGIGGLYNGPETEHGMPIEQLLSGPVFRRHPEWTWKYLHQLAKASLDARPNRAHEVIARFEQVFERCYTLTQNVDGLHSMAGARNVIEIHGNARRLRCTACAYRTGVTSLSDIEPIPPHCPECQAVLRPEVVLFEEMLPTEALQKLDAESKVAYDVVFSIGTSSAFPYIAFPVELATEMGIPTVEINPDQTSLSERVTIKLPLRAAEAFDAIWESYERAS